MAKTDTSNQRYKVTFASGKEATRMNKKIDKLIYDTLKLGDEAASLASEYKTSIFHTDRDRAITKYALGQMAQFLREAAMVYDNEMEKEITRQCGEEGAGG